MGKTIISLKVRDNPFKFISRVNLLKTKKKFRVVTFVQFNCQSRRVLVKIRNLGVF